MVIKRHLLVSFANFLKVQNSDFFNCLRWKSHKGQMKTKKLEISSLHMPKNHKGQMKIQQTAFMLLAVTVFFVLVGLAILLFKVGGIKETAEILEGDNAMLLVSKLANSPEFSCGEAFGTSKTDCVDADKIMVLKQNIDIYEDFWGVSGIEVEKIYPKNDEIIECDLITYPDCNLITIKKGTGYSFSNFVSLCRKESLENGQPYNKCELARLRVSYEPVS